jgi:putative membrane protein
MIARFLTKVLFTALATLVAAYVLSGVHVDSFVTAMIVAFVLGILNTFIKPILVLLTLPITLFTLGLFLLVINILIIKFAASIVPGFTVDNWWAALLFSILVSIVSSIMESLLGGHIKK